jgi:hypothetical protein
MNPRTKYSGKYLDLKERALRENVNYMTTKCSVKYVDIREMKPEYTKPSSCHLFCMVVKSRLLLLGL